MAQPQIPNPAHLTKICPPKADFTFKSPPIYPQNHRGIEKACEERTYTQDVYLIERICGICSHSHSTCFIQAVEEIAGLEIPKRALYIRTLIAELERVHSHLLWLGVAGHEIGFDTLLMYTWRDREVVMDILAMLTGNRVNYGMNTIGGVRRDVTAEQKQDVLKAIDILEERTKYYIQVATQEMTIIKRLSGVGVLLHDDAIRLGAVGPTARACGVDRDLRRDDPYAAYADLGLSPGKIAVIPPDNIGGISFCTHSLPLKVMTDYLLESFRCEIIIIGIQPKNLSVGASPSKEVLDAVESLSATIISVLQPG